jgi:hypothetical protein
MEIWPAFVAGTLGTAKAPKQQWRPDVGFRA